MTYDLREFPLLFVKIGIEQQARHSDNAVHGCSNFVAHGGEKFALRLACRLGLLLPTFQLRDICVHSYRAAIVGFCLTHPNPAPVCS